MGLMLYDKPHEAFIGGSASSIFQLYTLSLVELNTRHTNSATVHQDKLYIFWFLSLLPLFTFRNES